MKYGGRSFSASFGLEPDWFAMGLPSEAKARWSSPVIVSRRTGAAGAAALPAAWIVRTCCADAERAVQRRAAASTSRRRFAGDRRDGPDGLGCPEEGQNFSARNIGTLDCLKS